MLRNTITRYKNIKKQRGVTLIELIIAVVVIGMLAGMYQLTIGSGATSQTRGQAKMSVADTYTKAWTFIVSYTGISKDPISNSFFETGNNMLDVLVAGDVAVAATWDQQYNNSNAVLMDSSIDVITPPTAGTAGTYQVGPATLTITNGAGGDEILYNFTRTPREEVEFLLSQYEQGSTYDPATADTTGVIRYDVIGSDGHNLTIMRRVQ